MESQLIAVLIIAIIGSVYLTNAQHQSSSPSSIARECSRGPVNWCQNLSNAKQCNAVRHCIQTVWEKQDVPEDNDSICNICLDMVKQARDQLESNETQNDLKAVFEGSCKLILLKPVVQECMKLADDFIPELIEALASQMNPQVVCSVAGLCNNARYDKMLLEAEQVTTTTTTTPPSTPKTNDLTPKLDDSHNYARRILSCEECGYVSSVISTKFKITSRDDLLESILNLCGHTGSFSDACANIALTYFKTLYEYVASTVDANGICHLSGTCVAKYHQHPEDVQIQNWSSVGVLSTKDDIPCELCQQLVHHLQEVLTANTTELEFKQVLEGLCKQTKGFKAECLSIADQYYDKIYQTLVSNLDANGACFLIGVCPKGNGFLGQKNLMPLIPYVEPAKVSATITKLDKTNLPVYTKEEINSMQLPFDLLTVHKIPPTALTGNAELCTLCEYFLHFVQETLATPATEDKIKETVVHICDKFPTSLRGNCHNFVDMYGDAVIALLIQGFDPRQMCPRMELCPKNSEIDVTVSSAPQQDKSSCPMCLFAVKQAQELIRDNKSKQNIRSVLDSLCSHLSGNLKKECVDFVETYSNELVDMLITDFTPQQVCVYIKLCTSDIKAFDWANINIDDETLIDDLFSKEDSSIEIDEEQIISPECLLCEKVISEAEKKIGPVKNKDDIEKELYKACGKLKKLADKCHKYIDEYGDKIAALILMEMTPKQICKELGYCSVKNIDAIIGRDEIRSEQVQKTTVTVDPPPCVLCELIIKKLETQLNDKKTEEEIKQEVEHICKLMPKNIAGRCNQFIDKYGDLIIAMVQTVPPKEICKNLGLCGVQQPEKKVGDAPCLLCELIIKQLENLLSDNSTDQQIKQALESVCDILPKSVADSCDEFIKKYSNQIISLMQTLPPRAICENMILCSALEEKKLDNEVIECGICHGATSRLLTYINKKEDKKIKFQSMAETVCNDLPAKYYKKCAELLKYYGKSIQNMISRKTDQAKICAKIGKCFDEENPALAYVRIL